MEHRQEVPASWFADTSEVQSLPGRCAGRARRGQGRQAERSRAAHKVHQYGPSCLAFVKMRPLRRRRTHNGETLTTGRCIEALIERDERERRRVVIRRDDGGGELQAVRAAQRVHA